jgi:hypothetical protein
MIHRAGSRRYGQPNHRVKDATYRDLREPVPPTICIPNVQQEAPSIMSLSVRTTRVSPVLSIRPLAVALTPTHGDVTVTSRPRADQVYDG